jgi:NitT/TauT family transport system ATP-binding protein
MPSKLTSVALSNVDYTFPNGTEGLLGIDLKIPEGGFYCLVGRSGCGKTTCLKVAAGLLKPSSGSIEIGNIHIDGPSADVGFVFQTPSLLEWLTVIDNVLLPISLKGTITKSDEKIALELLELAGIKHLASRYPEQLSGGQQSRAALARSLVTSPPVLMMDEPFAALDALTREDLQDVLLSLVEARGTTVVFVTHDIGEAAYLGDKILIMEGGTITHEVVVDLARPRNTELRYEASFSKLCRKVRSAMLLGVEQC